ncbi:MAG: preprotein translocase subunit YajC [Candidatus Brocadiales bacterium]
MDFLAQASAKPSVFWTTMIPFMIMAVVIYVFILRPQKVKEAAREEMLDGIKKKDKVVTNGGLHGVVLSVKETELMLLIDSSKDIRVKVERDSIASILGKAEV